MGMEGRKLLFESQLRSVESLISFKQQVSVYYHVYFNQAQFVSVFLQLDIDACFRNSSSKVVFAPTLSTLNAGQPLMEEGSLARFPKFSSMQELVRCNEATELCEATLRTQEEAQLERQVQRANLQRRHADVDLQVAQLNSTISRSQQQSKRRCMSTAAGIQRKVCGSASGCARADATGQSTPCSDGVPDSGMVPL